MSKRFLILLLIMVLCLCGCRDVTQVIEDKVITTFKEEDPSSTAGETDPISPFGIEYNSEESLTPILTQSRANSFMLRSVYDCLINTDSTFMPTPSLCESWEGDGTTFKLKLRQGVKFHDGSFLTAKDVEYTLKYIKSNLDSPYYSRLTGVQSVNAVGSDTVEIVLSKPNILFASLLEIPIIKEKSIDKNSFVANGTGAYRIESKNTEPKLTIFDDYWHKSTSLQMKEILLFDVPNDDMQLYNFESGNVDVQYISLIDSSKMGAYGDFLQREISTQQLTYLAPNKRKAQLADGIICKAISMLIKRQELIDSALAKHAEVALTPLHPNWGLLRGYIPSIENVTDGSALLKQSGKKSLSFTLVVNSENQFKVGTANELSKMLSVYGIELKVKSLSWAEFNSALKIGSYDFYLGETKVPSDMDVSYLIGTGGSNNYTGAGNPALDAALTAVRGAQNLDEAASAAVDLCDVFAQTMPMVPLYFSNSTIIYRRDFQPPSGNTDSNPYGGIQNWSFISSQAEN